MHPYGRLSCQSESVCRDARKRKDYAAGGTAPGPDDDPFEEPSFGPISLRAGARTAGKLPLFCNLPLIMTTVSKPKFDNMLLQLGLQEAMSML